MRSPFKFLDPAFRHPIVVAVVGSVLSAWLITKCVNSPSPPSRTSPTVAVEPAPPALAEVDIHPPTRKQVEDDAGHSDPLTSFNDWARSVRALDKRYLERDEFLKRMHGKHVRWRGVVSNVGDAASDLDLVLHASPEVDEFYTVFHVWLPHKLHAKVFSLHDGDYVEVTGAYAGEVGLLQQPQIYGETVELITAAPPGPHK
jgi:hypothetical protein